jgi:hypothetical protein
MITTITASGPSWRPTSMAAHTAVPLEPPTRMPSSRESRRAVKKLSRSDTITTRSATVRS